jgi:hypothetical protein
MKSGDVCQNCKSAQFATVSSRAAGEYQIRYIKCPKCGASCRSVVKAENIRRRVICPAQNT